MDLQYFQYLLRHSIASHRILLIIIVKGRKESLQKQNADALRATVIANTRFLMYMLISLLDLKRKLLGFYLEIRNTNHTLECSETMHTNQELVLVVNVGLVTSISCCFKK